MTMTGDDDATALASTIAWVGERDCTPEEIADVLGKVEAHYARAKELRDSLKAAMVEHIEATGADLVIGDIRYYAGQEKKTECVAVRDTAEALLAKLEGDFAAVCEYLVAQPFKPGACRDFLDADTFASLFRTEVKAKLCEGKPRKQLIQAWEPKK